MAYADTFNELDDELSRLLQLLDYSKGYFFLSISERASGIVRKAVNQRGVKFLIDDSNLKYFLPKEDALKFEIK